MALQADYIEWQSGRGGHVYQRDLQHLAVSVRYIVDAYLQQWFAAVARDGLTRFVTQADQIMPT